MTGEGWQALAWPQGPIPLVGALGQVLPIWVVPNGAQRARPLCFLLAPSQHVRCPGGHDLGQRGLSAAETCLRGLRALCCLQKSSSVSFPEGGPSGGTCPGQTQSHPENDVSSDSLSGHEHGHPLVSTVGEGSWLEVGLARHPVLTERQPSRLMGCAM